MLKNILATSLDTLVKKSTHHMQPWHLDLVLNEHLKWHLKLDRTTYLKGNHKKNFFENVPTSLTWFMDGLMKVVYQIF